LLFYSCYNFAEQPASLELAAENQTITSGQVYQAQQAALQLYVQLLSCAADKYIHAAETLAGGQAVSAAEEHSSFLSRQGRPSSTTAASMSAATVAGAPPSPPSAAAGTASAGSCRNRAAETELLRKGAAMCQPPVLPPSFARYCAAITAWGSSIKNIGQIAYVNLILLNLEGTVGTSDYLLSWLPFGE
jgi:hypothetical protein